ncbi:cysteine proteinase inhibitor 6-like [Neltuma alba]|uniref:cysteine proteinase inhibitor 6-like n=1 Tax=Neltuma alba TaxID=207710 RepID=UPI0010A3BF1A|nr:cysteine proteinase inhibitor 6-like [Prosopis alba]XP_028783821.1 cysteine proteinase inhibitor 6-like [Prosopis alba]
MKAQNSLLLRSSSSSSSSIPSFSFLFVFLFLFLARPSLADCSDYDRPEMATVGGVHDSPGAQNSAEIEGLARFAVEEHNKKENALLEFARVVKAQEQVVAGTLHHLTIEAVDAGKRKLYEAKIWVKPWLNFKELQEFKHAGDVAAFTSSDLGVKTDGHKTGWQTVPAHDPQVQDAANHAVKTLQQRSNSLLPYELHEVVDAKAEVIDHSAKFNLLLKVKRGGKEEKFKAEVHQNNEGGYHLNQMEQDHS